MAAARGSDRPEVQERRAEMDRELREVEAKAGFYPGLIC